MSVVKWMQHFGQVHWSNMGELGPNEDVINCAGRDSLVRVTLTLLMKHT